MLSSHLASPDHFTSCKAEDLQADRRFTKVLRKMDGFVSENAIINLQEVSHSWAGPLHVYLAKKNYHFVYAPYGKHWNNYMGVGVAYPMTVYEAVDVHIQVIFSEHQKAEVCKIL